MEDWAAIGNQLLAQVPALDSVKRPELRKLIIEFTALAGSEQLPLPGEFGFGEGYSTAAYLVWSPRDKPSSQIEFSVERGIEFYRFEVGRTSIWHFAADDLDADRQEALLKVLRSAIL